MKILISIISISNNMNYQLAGSLALAASAVSACLAAMWPLNEIMPQRQYSIMA
jgi:hypothetical protein